MLTTCDGPAVIYVKARYLSKNRDFAPPEYCRNVWYGKVEWRGYPMVKKIENMFIRFSRIHERDRQTDGHRMTA